MKDIRPPRQRLSPVAAARQAWREAFARAMARSELGRHYWDESRQRELEVARRRRRKPPK